VPESQRFTSWRTSATRRQACVENTTDPSTRHASPDLAALVEQFCIEASTPRTGVAAEMPSSETCARRLAMLALKREIARDQAHDG